ncbi:hypothetical protein [Bacteroides faecium]|jgi:hypothetical protein|uniref:Uncharacterized protein n=1 Tax=Bacteroides faecium TaxID=2715212 RepID=A0A6H0KTJ2_9BACE|nr:hypothetical protein [Bacteroides faecium]QIU96463.1 hypothetical protein BacF7301_20925 [Bacteroides faecium]
MEMMNLNSEFFRQLSYIADDENYMKKALKSIKKLVAEKEKASTLANKEEIGDAEMTKSEILAGFDLACKDIKLRMEGRLEGRAAEDLLDEL